MQLVDDTPLFNPTSTLLGETDAGVKESIVGGF